MPAKAFSAPGPYCIAKTPAGLPLVTRAAPSAICTPTRSWRQITGRMPPATAASMIGVVGKQNIVEIPSRFRISVIASMTSIGVFPCQAFDIRRSAKPSAGTKLAPAGGTSALFPSLPRGCRIQFAQPGLHDLPRRGVRQFLDDQHVVGQHPARELLGKKGDQRV